MSERDVEIANTIGQQMGGLNKIRAMTGAKQFIAIENGLQFKFGLNKRMNTVRITLNGSDLYDVEFWQITPKRCVKRSEQNDVYCDMLIDIFETETGLYLHL